MQLDVITPGETGEGSDPIGLADIHQDQPGHGSEINLLDPLEPVAIAAAFEEEFAEGAFLGTGKNQFGFRVEFLGRDHRSEAIKIGIDVGGDDLHTRPGLRQGCRSCAACRTGCAANT